MSKGSRPVAALVLPGLVLAATLVIAGGTGQPGPGPQGIKQSWLRQASRPAAASDVIRTAQPRPAARVEYVPGRVVVKFEADLRVRQFRSLAREAGATSVQRPSWADFHYVQIPADADPAAVAARLRAEPGVVYAEPDPIVRPLWQPNDQYFDLQWNLRRIGMETAWEINRGGSSRITVAVIDSGVAYANQGAFAQAPDLAGTRFVAGYDFIWEDEVPTDTDGHGTHVAGTIAQTTNNSTGLAGIAFNVGIMPIKVLTSDWDDENGAPNPPSMSVLARGIRFAADHGVQVINLSLGAEGESATVESAIRYAIGKGVFVAAAAGNSGDEGNGAEWPASYAKDIDGLMAVAAVDYDLARAAYSTHRDYVEIAAPGGNVRADVNDDDYPDGILQQTLDPDFQERGIFNRFAYMFYQGTSMATPHVSALAALLMDQGITNPAAVEAAIKRFASHKPSGGGRNDDIGYGVVDPRASLFGLGLAK
jgi:serine protease